MIMSFFRHIENDVNENALVVSWDWKMGVCVHAVCCMNPFCISPVENLFYVPTLRVPQLF